MKKILLISFVLLLPYLFKEGHCLGRFDQQTWKVVTPSTSSLGGVDTVLAERWQAGNFNVGTSTFAVNIILYATGTVNATQFEGDGSALTSISSSAIAQSSIGNYHIIDSTITGADIAQNVIGNYHLISSTVTTTEIKDATIANADIAANAIGNFNIIAGTITNSDMGADSIGGYNIISGTVTVSDLAQNSVGNYQIIDSTITSNDLAQNSVGNYHIINSTIQLADIDLSSVTLSGFTNDAGFITGSYEGFVSTAGDTMSGTLNMNNFAIQSSSSITANEFFGDGSSLTGVSAVASSFTVTGYYVSIDSQTSDTATIHFATKAYNGASFNEIETISVSTSVFRSSTGYTLNYLDKLILGFSGVDASDPFGDIQVLVRGIGRDMEFEKYIGDVYDSTAAVVNGLRQIIIKNE